MDRTQELEQLKAELNAEMARGALKDSVKVEALQAMIHEIEESQQEEERKRQYKQLVEESTNDIEYILDGLNFDGVTMRALCTDEKSYQVLRIAVQQIMIDRDEARIKEITQIQAEHEEHERKLRDEKEALQRSYEELYETNVELRKEIYNLKQENEDLDKKRTAAAAEIDRLNSQVDDLRADKAVGAAQAVKVVQTNMNSNLGEIVQAFKNSRPAIINKIALDGKRSRFGAELVETGETIEFSYLEEGKYREVTAEEAERFREEAKAKREAEEAAKLVEGSLPVPVIPSENESAGDGLDQTDASVEVAGEDAALLKRIEELEVAVFGRIKGEAA